MYENAVIEVLNDAGEVIDIEEINAIEVPEFESFEEFSAWLDNGCK